MVGIFSTVPSGTPRRLVKLPAATLRMMTSSGTISTFFTSVSRSDNSSTKWVGTPFSASIFIRLLESLLFTTPLPRMVPFFAPSPAVASSL